MPPVGPNESVPLNFDLSPSYVDRLDAEFTRVYEEYSRRIATVQALAEHIIQLWAELGTPQAQQDGTIVKYYREAPEQLGLHEEDMARLRSKRDRLAEEKKSREKRLRELRAAVEALWEKLEIDGSETKPFLNANRGCGVRQINEFEDELGRLNELKRQNMHLFVEDARVRLQDLWDALYFSEDEMLEFTPAFSDVYSDALLEAHEREVARLEALKEQRAPILALVDRHKTLIKERDDLQTSSQDASRLMARGQKGEKRDPGKLLREEKMRKRIAKELPKVTAEVCRALEQWEDEYGRPFLVFGDRYLDEMEASEAKRPGTARSRTPANPPPPSAVKTPKSVPRSVPVKTHGSRAHVPPRVGNKTPMANTQGRKTQAPNNASIKGSPSRIPARAPLSNLKHGNNSPERPRQEAWPASRAQPRPPSRPGSRGDALRNGAPMRAPPPKMRELLSGPALEMPNKAYSGAGGFGSSIVRHVEPEDVYDDGARATSSHSLRSQSAQRGHTDGGEGENGGDSGYATIRGAHHQLQLQLQQHPVSQTFRHPPPPRQVSTTSYTSTAISGSENWETYDDNSEPEPDACDAYYAKLRAARGKRMTPEQGHRPTSSQAKRIRGIPPVQGACGGAGGGVIVDQGGNRVVSGSEWTDEDAF